MPGKIVPNIINDQTLHTLHPDSSVHEAAKLMAAKHISAVLITENNHLVGIVTERDMTAKVLANAMDPDVTLLSAVMTPDPDVLSPNDTSLDALELMRERGYRHLPIVDGDRIVGIVSIRDLYAKAKEELEEDVRQREAFIFDTGYGAGA